MSELDVLIIGGGISGLSIAQRLTREDACVEVWEKEDHPGGKIQSDNRDGYLTEQAAAMVLNFRPEVNRFITESGLDDCKKPRADTSHRYIVNHGQLNKLPMKLGPMMASGMWSTRGKLRMMLEPFIPKGGSSNETVSEFIIRRLGREVLDKAMGPYVAGPLASDPELANASSILPRLVALEKRYGSIAMGVFVHRILKRKTGTETEAFSFQDGMATLVKSLAYNHGVCFRGGHTVTNLLQTKNGWHVTADTTAGERSVNARQVVLSVPANIAATLLAAHSAELAKLLDDIKYASLVVAHTGFDKTAIKHPLDGNGFLTQSKGGSNSKTSLNGCLWMSSLFSNHAPPGKTLLSNYFGGAKNPEAIKLSDDCLINETMKTLAPLLSIHGEPEMVRINRHQQGLPLYHGDYYSRMQQLKKLLTQLPGLHLEANYRGGISIRDRLVCAMLSSENILRNIQSSSTTYSLNKLKLEPQN